MAPAFQFCGSAHLSVWEKAVPQLSLDAWHFSSSPYAMVPLKQLPPCSSSERVSLSKFMCGFFKRDCLGLQKCLLLTQSLLVFAARIMGAYIPGTGTFCWETRCEAGSPHSWNIPLEFLSTTRGCGTSPFHDSAPPTGLDGCGLFNSVVVRLSFNSISDSSECWLFYSCNFDAVVWGGEPC